jgi:antitoxin (DNA-binding transcriptional repressor) of toxin-antitoxin stability system
VVILRNGSPIARLVAARPSVRRQFGHDRGSYAVPDDFDAPLPEAVVETFER